MSKLDLTKPVRTRDGRPVRILCTDYNNGDFPVVGIVKGKARELICTWQLNGQNSDIRQVDLDLVNIQETKVAYRNTRFSKASNTWYSSFYETEEKAKFMRIADKTFVYTEVATKVEVEIS